MARFAVANRGLIGEPALQSAFTITAGAPVDTVAEGVPTDGTDGTTALRAAATLAALRNVELRVSGAHKITGTGIDIAGVPLVRILAAQDATGLASGQAAFYAVGTAGTPVNLAGNATAGDVQLTVAAGAEAQFADGDVLDVNANTYWAGSGPAGVTGVDAYIGEKATVKGTPTPGSGVIALTAPLELGYTVAASATVKKLTMVDGIELKTRGPGKIVCGGSTKNQRGIKLDRVLRVRVDARIDAAEDVGVFCEDCIDVNVRMRGDGGGAHTNSTFYAVSFQGCQDVWWAGSRPRRYKHGVTCSGSTTRPGINFRVHYANSIVSDTLSTGIDCHAMVVDLKVLGNTVKNPGNAADDAGDFGGGISIRCPSATLADNTIKNAATYGIWLRNQSNQPTSYQVNGGTITNPGQEGVKFDLHTPTSAGRTIDQITMKGVDVRNAGTSGSGYDGFYFYSSNADRLARIALIGCNVYGATSYGLHVVQCDMVSIVGGNLSACATYSSPGVWTGGGGVKLDNCTLFSVTGLSTSSPGAGIGKGVYCLGSTATGTVAGCVFSGFAIGVHLDSSTAGIVAGPSAFTGCTANVTDAGTGNKQVTVA